MFTKISDASTISGNFPHAQRHSEPSAGSAVCLGGKSKVEGKSVHETPNIELTPEFYDAHASLFNLLQETIAWNESMRSRKTASFGKPYEYSQMTYEATEIPACLRPLQSQLIEHLAIPFNNCLLNLYESGENTMGFHSDETSGLVPGTGVSIVSLGCQRTITFRSIDRRTRVDYSLPPGSMLYMNAGVQDDWQHAIRRQPLAKSRISLTWRAIE